MKLLIKIRFLYFILLCITPGYLQAQFTVLMEIYPPNSYYEEVPLKIESSDFQKGLLDKVHETGKLKFLNRCFYYDNKSGAYLLKNDLPPAANEELKSLFITTGYLKPEGASVEITREVFSRMGIKPDYKLFPWARCIELMKSGDADAILDVFKTPEREKFLYYPSDYNVKVENAFFCLADSKFNFDGNLEKLQGHWIGVKASTSYGSKFDGAQFLSKRETSYTQAVIRLVENKRVEAGVGPIRGIKFFTKKMGNQQKFKFLKPSLCNNPLYIAFSKKRNTQKIVGDFSRELQAFKKTNKYREILSKYGF